MRPLQATRSGIYNKNRKNGRKKNYKKGYTQTEITTGGFEDLQHHNPINGGRSSGHP
jgi:hypothetical protein